VIAEAAGCHKPKDHTHLQYGADGFGLGSVTGVAWRAVANPSGSPFYFWLFSFRLFLIADPGPHPKRQSTLQTSKHKGRVPGSHRTGTPGPHHEKLVINH
jgi:hypothetical protein